MLKAKRRIMKTQNIFHHAKNIINLQKNPLKERKKPKSFQILELYKLISIFLNTKPRYIIFQKSSYKIRPTTTTTT
jgi:hypothetical protein